MFRLSSEITKKKNKLEIYPFIGRSIGIVHSSGNLLFADQNTGYKIQTPSFHNVDQSKQTIIYFPAKSQLHYSSAHRLKSNDRKIFVCSNVR